MLDLRFCSLRMRIHLAICLLATCEASRFQPLKTDNDYDLEPLLSGKQDPYDDDDFEEILFGDGGAYEEEYDEKWDDEEVSSTWKEPPRSLKGTPPIPIRGSVTPSSMSSGHDDLRLKVFMHRVETPTRMAELEKIITDSRSMAELEMKYIEASDLLVSDFRELHKHMYDLGSGVADSEDFAEIDGDYVQKEKQLEAVYRRTKARLNGI